jgi:autophagy-related protein 5
MYYSGDMDSYTNISTRLKLGLFEEDWSVATSSAERQQGSDEPESPGSVRPCTFFCIKIFYVIFT